MLGKPAQVEVGKYDIGGLSGAAVELQSEVDHALTARRIGPVITDSEAVSAHGTLEERHIRDRGIGVRAARAKYPTLGICHRQQTVIGVLRSQRSEELIAGVALLRQQVVQITKQFGEEIGAINTRIIAGQSN